MVETGWREKVERGRMIRKGIFTLLRLSGPGTWRHARLLAACHNIGQLFLEEPFPGCPFPPIVREGNYRPYRPEPPFSFLLHHLDRMR